MAPEDDDFAVDRPRGRKVSLLLLPSDNFLGGCCSEMEDDRGCIAIGRIIQLERKKNKIEWVKEKS